MILKLKGLTRIDLAPMYFYRWWKIRAYVVLRKSLVVLENLIFLGIFVFLLF